MREHAALRRAGRAGGVDEGVDVVRADRRRGARLSSASSTLAPARAELVERDRVGDVAVGVDRDDVRRFGSCVADRAGSSRAARRPRRRSRPTRSSRRPTRTPRASWSGRSGRRRRRRALIAKRRVGPLGARVATRIETRSPFCDARGRSGRARSRETISPTSANVDVDPVVADLVAHHRRLSPYCSAACGSRSAIVVDAVVDVVPASIGFTLSSCVDPRARRFYAARRLHAKGAPPGRAFQRRVPGEWLRHGRPCVAHGALPDARQAGEEERLVDAALEDGHTELHALRDHFAPLESGLVEPARSASGDLPSERPSCSLGGDVDAV